MASSAGSYGRSGRSQRRVEDPGQRFHTAFVCSCEKQIHVYARRCIDLHRQTHVHTMHTRHLDLAGNESDLRSDIWERNI